MVRPIDSRLKRATERAPHPAKDYTAPQLLAIMAAAIVALTAPYWGTALAIWAGWL